MISEADFKAIQPKTPNCSPSPSHVHSGVPIPKAMRVRLFSPDEWEEFTEEWASSIESDYTKVRRFGGAGDLGVDIAGFCSDQGYEGVWDNYQCKRYDHPLRPGDIWVEIGKIIYYSYLGEYVPPRRHYFICSQDIGTSLEKLLNKPTELKVKMVENWDKHCLNGITSTVSIATEIEDMGEERDELTSQLDRLETSIEGQRESLSAAQRQLESLLTRRREALEDRRGMQDRLDEITDLLARFDLLREHYAVDIDRLQAIRESGSMFAHVEAIPCPLCGANPEAQHLEKTCEGDVDAIVVAAIAEIEKIERLLGELEGTVADLRAEEDELKESLAAKDSTYQQLDKTLQEAVAPEVSDFRNSFSEIVEKRADVQKAIDLFARRDKLENRKLALQDEGETREDGGAVKAGIPESVAHSLSKKVSSILKAWDFPGECHVYFDKQSTDFVIDGKPRGSRGKGLRAITHAAVSIALLEYCQENGLSHPGFVVLDSPLLAYFKPEGEDDLALKGTDLKERFYDYLVTHHGEDSQVIIIENQHPPQSMEDRLVMTIFTGNPNEGRFGLL